MYKILFLGVSITLYLETYETACQKYTDLTDRHTSLYSQLTDPYQDINDLFLIPRNES